jgi:transposase
MSHGGLYSTVEVRRRAVQALERGIGVTHVAEAYGVHRATLHRWLARYDLEGVKGLARRSGSGRPRKLTELGEADFRWLVLQPASAFGYETDLWTVGRLQVVLEGYVGIDLSRDTVWRRLREAGLTYQKPERHYWEADEEARQEWLRREVPRIRRTVRKFRAILYFQDEANVSLTAFLGKTWSMRGVTPKVKVTGHRGGVAAMSAIARRGHLLFRLYDKRIASAEVIEFLGQMLKHHPRRHLVVVMDQAPPHVSKVTTAFIDNQPRLHVFHLPKYSPDWNPDEKVWNHLKHHELKAHGAKTKEELKVLTTQKLATMSRDPELIQGLFFRCCVADLFG